MSDSQPQAKPCPWCGETPDINDPCIFLETDGPKWGALHCCGTGPEVRTHYEPVDKWRDRAIAAWNERAQPERDELLAALTELRRVVLYIHPDVYCAIAAAERLIAGDKTE